MASALQQFYAGRVIFITGGSGFLGKLLLLKLLQSCPDIGGIIICLREKRGQSCRERLFNIHETTAWVFWRAGSVPEDQLGESTHRIVIVTSTEGPFRNVSIVCHKRDFVTVVKYWRMQAMCQPNHYHKETKAIKGRFEGPISLKWREISNEWLGATVFSFRVFISFYLFLYHTVHVVSLWC